MQGSETTIVRRDGDNRPLSIDVVTGVVERPTTRYQARLRSESAWRLFCSLVGIAYGAEVPSLIRACNRVADCTTLTSDEGRQSAALGYAGIAKRLPQAKPHDANCRCPRCLTAHIAAGCRRVGCRVCFG